MEQTENNLYYKNYETLIDRAGEKFGLEISDKLLLKKCLMHMKELPLEYQVEAAFLMYSQMYN